MENEKVSLLVDGQPKKLTNKQPSVGKQMKALFLKNLTLQKRRKIETCCAIGCPLTSIILVGVLNILMTQLLAKLPTTQIFIDTNPMPLIPDDPLLAKLVFFDATSNSKFDFGTLGPDGQQSGFIGHIPTVPLDPTIPFVNPFPTQDALIQNISAIKTKIAQITSPFFQPDPSFYLPISSWIFEQISNESLTANIMYESQPRYSLNVPNEGILGLSAQTVATSASISTLSNAAISNFITPNITFDAFIQNFPFVLSINIDISGLIAAGLFPFAFSFLMAIFVFNFVSEKEEKLTEMMKMVILMNPNEFEMGLKTFNFYVINCVYHAILYLFTVTGLLAVALAFQLPIFLKTSGWITFLSIFGWGLNLIAFTTMLSTLFSSGRTSKIVVNLLMVFSVLIANGLNFSIFNPTTSRASVFYLLWPPFAFYRAIFLMGFHCAQGCLQTQDIAGSEFVDIFLILFLETPLFLILTAYLDQVFPKKYGIQRPFWFPFQEISKLISKTSTKFESQKSEEEEYHMIVPEQYKEDADVKLEREKVKKMVVDGTIPYYPVVIKGLKKNYDDKLAVVDYFLAIENDTCFGLLGPNGAGKTTIISVLTGLYMPTSGDAWISGFNIKSEMKQVQQMIGVCPQFDVLWPSLTVLETVLFYVRLKNAAFSKTEELQLAKKCVQQVNLEAASDKLVSELSGGMKRRLSIAVSLIGEPPVIFLDEPTTGLDPETRRELWNLLNVLKKGKCIILTTHSMEEADVLCNRIGIMSRGMLQCLGTNVHLKNRYGHGYTLKLSYSHDDEESVMEFVREFVPKAVLESSLPGSCSFKLVSKDVMISDVLDALLKFKEKSKIRDWGLSQTTLEDVFLNIIKNDE